MAKNKIDEGKASHNMVNSNKNEHFLFTLIYLSLTVLIPAFIMEVFHLDFVFFIVFILYSLIPFAVIFGILLRVDVINGIKLVYEKNSNLSIEEIAQKSGTSEDTVLYILSKIKSKEEAQQLKFIQKNNFSMRGKIPDDSVIDKFKENEIMEIDPKCEVSFEANKLKVFIDESEQISFLYIVFILLMLFIYMTILFSPLHIPTSDLDGISNLFFVIIWIFLIGVDVLYLFGIYWYFRCRGRNIEIVLRKDDQLLIRRKIAPKYKLLNKLYFTEIRTLRIFRKSTEYGDYFTLKMILHKNKKIKILKGCEFSKCRDLGNLLASFLQIPITSKYYYDFLECNSIAIESREKIFRQKLLPQEYNVIKTLEDIIGKKIPFKSKLPLEGFSFSTNNRHVIHLNLTNCRLKFLPEIIGNLKSLKTLFLNNNKLITLPKTMGQLKILEELSINNNKLVILPDTLGHLKLLKKLSLKNNKIEIFPNCIINLESLQTLFLENNKLAEVPDTLGSLNCLKELSLSSNKLKFLPKSIGNLEALQTLLLNNNKLVSLPETIGNMISLQELYLNFNYLSSLPTSIGKLDSLQMLNIIKNRLNSQTELINNIKSKGIKIFYDNRF